MDPYGKVPKVVNLEVLASKVNDEYSYILYSKKRQTRMGHSWQRVTVPVEAFPFQS